VISKNSLKDRLSRYREITISVIGRKSGRKISILEWFVVEGDEPHLPGGGALKAQIKRRPLGSIRFVRFWRGQELKPEITQEVGLVAASRFQAASGHEEEDHWAMNFIAKSKIDGGLVL
jgi:hypothetical protein